MSNKKKGTSAESRFLDKKRLFQYAGSRFYASKGLFDAIFVDSDYVSWLVQIKSSSVKGKKPYMPQDEITDIQIYVDQFGLKGVPHIWVGYVLMSSRQPPIEVRLN